MTSRTKNHGNFISDRDYKHCLMNGHINGNEEYCYEYNTNSIFSSIYQQENMSSEYTNISKQYNNINSNTIGAYTWEEKSCVSSVCNEEHLEYKNRGMALDENEWLTQFHNYNFDSETIHHPNGIDIQSWYDSIINDTAPYMIPKPSNLSTLNKNNEERKAIYEIKEAIETKQVEQRSTDYNQMHENKHHATEELSINRTRAKSSSSPTPTATTEHRTFICQIPTCQRRFKRLEHLKRHFRSIHTLDRPFACSVPGCLKTFSRSDNMTQHLKTHKNRLH